ncbi:MAG: ATP-binding protein [Candidatus Nanopelagicales bacterium]
MDLSAAEVAIVLCALVGGAVGWFLGHRGAATTPRQEPGGVPSPDVPEGLDRLLAVLPGAAFVVGVGDDVLRASAKAVALGVAPGSRLPFPEVRALVAAVRRDGEIRDADLVLRRPPIESAEMQVRVRVALLSATAVLVLVEDLSEARRLDAVRRDFVANVSHELKTPVGALSLLAEAVDSASDDPATVRRFAGRMQGETARLTNLVNDLVDLSKLQDGDPLEYTERVDVDHVVREAVDATKNLATAGEIDLVVGEQSGACVVGDEQQLVMALRNLVTNAITYSPPRTRVGIATRVRDGVVEITVSDQGMGIPLEEQDRIFERFYRVDQARSRVTGGTGLGLALVKHVCANHAGECTVWSVPGEGSTFTLRLPQAPQPSPLPEGASNP